jgi:hypothetical protein
MPAWVLAAVAGAVTPNGAFNIETPLGQARVHPGHNVVSRDGKLWAVHPSEQAEFLNMLDDQDRDVSLLDEAERAAETSVKFAGIRHSRDEANVAERGDDTDEISARIATCGTEDTRQRLSTVPAASLKVEPPRLKLAPAIGMPPSIENRYTNELKIDDTYQRSIDTEASQKLIRRIAANWDWRMCLPLVVSRREGGLYVIDGQHRLAAAQLRSDIPFLPCCLTTYGSVAEEAAMFVAMNRTRRAINRLDDFHAATAGGDEDALAVRELIIGAGFKVARRTGSQSWVPGEVAFTASVEKVRRKHGDAICARALRLMAEAFPDEVLNAGASVFTALTKIFVGGDAPDEERLLHALLRFDQKGWASFVSSVKGGGEDRAFALKSALLMAYEEVP